MYYADVIVPLPLEGLFTYAVPAAWGEPDLTGYRVTVPWGKTRSYTALVAQCHHTMPAFDTKELLSVVDDHPIILPTQYKLWQWIASYFMSPIGEVYKAALPAGLKVEEGYKPRTETCITLGDDYRTRDAITAAITSLCRARKQQEVLQEFLRLSHWHERLHGDAAVALQTVSRSELLNSAHATLAIVNALCARGILTTYTIEVGRLQRSNDENKQPMKPLTFPQLRAYDDINRCFKDKATVLLHGVTSSGKTEIYIHLIADAVKRGQQVLYLLPEIALTVQIMQRLQAVFGEKLGIYHSRYTDAERVEMWQKQLSDDPYAVVLGARSAVFLPYKNLGLVIIDEEHESSFKQVEPAPRYHARSTALVLAKMVGAKTVLGTATPAIESYYNAQKEKYALVPLKTRYEGLALPEVTVVDIADLRRRKLMTGTFSPTLIAAIRETLDEDKQVILFHNRRGYSREVECKDCGWVPQCKNCDVALTLHKTINLLTCHYCGATEAIPDHCPACEGRHLIQHGMGTEKIEDELLSLFPAARVARMDLDSTRSQHAYDRLLSDFAQGKTNVLVGTQMVTKGLDFDNVSVVGILDADTLLHQPNFRAYETAYNMMSQVSGRAGRKGQQGRVILQTKQPQLSVIQQIVHNDYPAFYADTIAERQEFNYPPFSHIINIELRHKNAEIVTVAAEQMAAQLRERLATRVLGPDKPAVARVKQLHIRMIMLKIEATIPLSAVRPVLVAARDTLAATPRTASVMVLFDVDPL